MVPPLHFQVNLTNYIPRILERGLKPQPSPRLGRAWGRPLLWVHPSPAPLHFTDGRLTRKHSPLYAHLKAPKIEGNGAIQGILAWDGKGGLVKEISEWHRV